MPYLRLSRARKLYVCVGCAREIRIGQTYFRDEPHPMARLRRALQVQHLCPVCVLGERDAAALHGSDLQVEQLRFAFTLENAGDGRLLVAPRVELIDVTPQLLKMLAQDPERLHELTPDSFEALVCNRLDEMGYDFERVGPSTFRKDGGIDIIACPRSVVVPFLMAVQVKHVRMASRKIGPQPVRELIGSMALKELNAGLVVTNTGFTPDAQWVAKQRPMLVQLRDGEDLRRWLRNEFLRTEEWRAIPTEIEVCPGVKVKVPR